MVTHVIGIVGAGALGSHFALFGRNWDSAFFMKEGDRLTIKIVDFDKVEHKNTLGQFHGRQSKGRNKAQALKQSLMGMFGTRMHAVPSKLVEDNVDAVLDECSLIVDCTDNIKARQLIQGFVTQNPPIPCVHAALAADGTFGQIIWTEDFKPDPEGFEDEGTCEDGEGLPFHGLVAAQLACTVQRYLTDGTRQGFQLTPGGSTLVTSVGPNGSYARTRK